MEKIPRRCSAAASSYARLRPVRRRGRRCRLPIAQEQPHRRPVRAQGTTPPVLPTKWDLEADVVVIGSGAVGLPAAIRAVDAGASVIVVDTNYDIGGHAIISGGNMPLGGGTSAQKKYKIEDSPDVLFRDLTDWSVVEVSGMPEYRYNDRGVQRALADNEAADLRIPGRERRAVRGPGPGQQRRACDRHLGHAREPHDLGRGPEPGEPGRAQAAPASCGRWRPARARRASSSC